MAKHRINRIKIKFG